MVISMKYLLCKIKKHEVVKVFDNTHDLLAYATNHADTDYEHYSIIGYRDLEHGLNGLTYVQLVNYKNHANWRPGSIRLITEMKDEKNIKQIYATLFEALKLEFGLKFLRLYKSQQQLVPLVKADMDEHIQLNNLNWFWGSGNWRKLINSIYYNESSNFLPFVLREAYNNCVYIQIKQSLHKLNHEINV